MPEKGAKMDEMTPETVQKPQKRPKTGGRKKGTPNKKTRNSQSMAWATLKAVGAARRLEKLLDSASPNMQARILLSLMKAAFGEPKPYEGPAESSDKTTNTIAAARARVASLKTLPAEPTKTAAPSYPEWIRENKLEPAPEVREEPPQRPTRARRVIVQ